MHDENPSKVTVERLIIARAETIFELLAHPSRHHEIDGSGAVRRQRSGPSRLELGSTFVMSMKMFIPYSTKSTVVEFEENRSIAWQTFSTIRWIARWGGGRVWSYELLPDGGATLVRETWDPSLEAPRARKNLEKERTRNYMIKAMDKTLEKLDDALGE